MLSLQERSDCTLFSLSVPDAEGSSPGVKFSVQGVAKNKQASSASDSAWQQGWPWHETIALSRQGLVQIRHDFKQPRLLMPGMTATFWKADKGDHRTVHARNAGL